MEHRRIAGCSDRLLVGVSRDWQESPRVRALELVALDEAPLPAFTAGAHITLHLPDGLTRPYSLCGDPEQRTVYRLGVLATETSAGGSSYMHQTLAIGDRLLIEPPQNHFPLMPGDRPIVLIAGGIGITPLLSMAFVLARRRHPYHLYYFVRDPAPVAFAGLLQAGLLCGQATIIEGTAPARPSPADLLRRHDAADVYCCGPARLMEATKIAAAALGLAYRAEAFTPSPDSDTPLAAAGFEVELARSGRRLTVPPDMSVSAVLRASGVMIETMCEGGYCGTCLTNVLAGEVDHRDSILTDQERQSNAVMAICCSRAKTPLLVLDV